VARRKTVLAIPLPADVADVLLVLTGVAPSYDLARLEVEAPKTKDGPSHLLLTAGQRRVGAGATYDMGTADAEEPDDDDESVVGIFREVELSHAPKPFPETGRPLGREELALLGTPELPDQPDGDKPPPTDADDPFLSAEEDFMAGLEPRASSR
jgi:hypothetical protein